MISSELYHQVRRIHIRTNRLVNETFGGEYLSAFKGHGMEFAEVREYAPGDDVRSIDWNVTARRGHPYIKRYVEERELTVMLLVDLSASGHFGTIGRLKKDIGTELCAVLALSAINNNDRVGLLLFTDKIEKFVPPQKGKRHGMRIIRDLLLFRPQQRRTDMGLALDFLHHISRRRTVSFLISDFMTSGYDMPLRLAHRRHDMIPISISDRREASPAGTRPGGPGGPRDRGVHAGGHGEQRGARRLPPPARSRPRKTPAPVQVAAHRFDRGEHRGAVHSPPAAVFPAAGEARRQGLGLTRGPHAPLFPT